MEPVTVDFPDCVTNFVLTDSTNLDFPTNFVYTDCANSETIMTSVVYTDFENFDFLTNFVCTDYTNSETILDLPNGTKVLRIIKPNLYPVDSRICHANSEENQDRRATNYILGRPRSLPEIERVSDCVEVKDDNEVPPSFRRFSLYAKEPSELADAFFANSTKSHMQKYFKRRKKEDKEQTNKTPKPYVRRRKKPKNTYVTKEMKLSRVKFEPVPRAKVIDGLLKSR